MSERIVEQRRIVGADEFLHDEGRVGAEHHHFAMRHVDDAHHAEGDGKADRRQQQHRAEREPVPGVLHRAPEREIALDLRAGGSRGLTHRRRQVGRQAVDQAERILVAAVADDGDGGDLVLGAAVVGGKARWRRALRSAPFSRADRFPWRAPCRSLASALASRDLNTACAASKRRLGSVAIKRQRAERGIDHAAQRGC